MSEADDPFKVVVLEPGDFYFGSGRTRISTLLGSCISITLWHPRKRIGGMCHYMLTERNAQIARPAQWPLSALDGRYASEAFSLFLQHVEAAGTRPSEYQAKLFGGGNMFIGGSSGKMDIGPRNIEYGRKLLASKNIALMAEHVGGSGRRKLHFELWSGHVLLAFPDGSGAQTRTMYG
jgi:chemotaxis protein CheD